MEVMKKENNEELKPKFDILVTHRDPKTGQVTHSTPYTMRAFKGGEDGSTIKVWERPVGSGNVFWGDGKPAGRWVDGQFVKGAPHVRYVAPETQDQKIARALNEKDSEIEALRKELAAIKADSAPKAPVKEETKKKQGS